MYESRIKAERCDYTSVIRDALAGNLSSGSATQARRMCKMDIQLWCKRMEPFNRAKCQQQMRRQRTQGLQSQCNVCAVTKHRLKNFHMNFQLIELLKY
jgi:hypothetical protein